MKKIITILAVLLLVTVLFLVYLWLTNRKPIPWGTASPAAKGTASSAQNRAEFTDQALFLNDFYQNYQSLTLIDHSRPRRFSARLHAVPVLIGGKRAINNKLVITGKEIVIALWTPGKPAALNHPDMLEIVLSPGRNIKVEILAVPKATSITAKFKTLINENILNHMTAGEPIHLTRVAAAQKGEFKTVPIHLPKPLNTGDKRIDGFLVKITPTGKAKKVKVKIKNIHLMNRNYKIIENMPQTGYLKYGGADRRLLKSVFLRTGCTLTYAINTGTESHPSTGQRIFLDGYLGSKTEKPLTFKIAVNEQTLLDKKVSVGVPYFRFPIPPNQGVIKLSFSVEGEENMLGALGNVCLFHQSKEKRNVVYYLIDALRADKGGITGNLLEKSFEKGAVFKNAYANATQTVDSLSTLFSGKYKFTLVEKDGENPHLQEDEFLLAEYFKSKGYTTAAFINNPWLHLSNSSQGFDVVNFCWNHVPKASAFPSEKEYIDMKYGDMQIYLEKFVRENKDKPLFLFIHTMEPHVPYEPPLSMRKFSAHADPQILNTLFEKVTQSPVYPTLTNPRTEELNTLKFLYKDQVQIAAGFFEKIYAYLEKEAIIDASSLFILTSDHGERFYEHKSWTHGKPDVYNEVLRIPFMMKGPRILPGIYNQKVQLTDIYPTIMDWMGDKPAKNLVGHSLIREMNKNTDQRVIYVDGAGKSPAYAYIKGYIKVIISRRKTEVYDLHKDPGEKVNLAAEKQFKKLIGEARVFVKKFKPRTGKNVNRPGLTEQQKRRLKTLGYID